MENMIALTTPSETKLLREAGLIFVHPDCHVSMNGKVKKAALLKNLCTAASEGRLYYRDMRLYAYPEEPGSESGIRAMILSLFRSVSFRQAYEDTMMVATRNV